MRIFTIKNTTAFLNYSMSLASSELILNADQSIYHLHLKPNEISNNIITVGDPDRVAEVSAHFDFIELKKQKREFVTHTGTYKNKRISVISTGIGTDNIDIVLNELDALVNIDFSNRVLKEKFTQLNIFRLGTSGAIQANIPVDSILISEKAIGLDALLHFYDANHLLDKPFSEAFKKHMNWSLDKSSPYVVSASTDLLNIYNELDVLKGITLTNVGFYGPQGRMLRLPLFDEKMKDSLESFRFKNQLITNLEMETSGIYGLAALLGHKAVSVNCILANRANETFSAHPNEVVKKAIKMTLDLMVKNDL
jgi:uridine phosphorylase